MWIIRQNTESIVQTCIIILLAGYKLNLPFRAECRNWLLTIPKQDGTIYKLTAETAERNLKKPVGTELF